MEHGNHEQEREPPAQRWKEDHTAHIDTRRPILLQVRALLEDKYPGPDSESRLNRISRTLEYRLYMDSETQEEYLDLNTLKTRLRDVVRRIYVDAGVPPPLPRDRPSLIEPDEIDGVVGDELDVELGVDIMSEDEMDGDIDVDVDVDGNVLVKLGETPEEFYNCEGNRCMREDILPIHAQAFNSGSDAEKAIIVREILGLCKQLNLRIVKRLHDSTKVWEDLTLEEADGMVRGMIVSVSDEGVLRSAIARK